MATVLAATPSDAEDGITVVGNGEAQAMPDTIELRARVIGSAELGSDAWLKFQDYRRRTRSAIDRLKLADLKVAFGGLSVTSAGSDDEDYEEFDAPPDASAPKAAVAVSSVVRLSQSGIRELTEEKVMELAARLVDALRDAGVSVEPVEEIMSDVDDVDADDQPLLAAFVLEDASDLRRQARQRAFQSARASAEGLAELAGAKVGRVLAIQELPGTTIYNSPYYGAGVRQLAPDSKIRLVSRRFAPVRVQANLQVRFAVEE